MHDWGLTPKLNHMSTLALKEAIKKAGSRSALARLLRVHHTSIRDWQKTGRVPAERVLSVEAVTGVPRHQLRPDLYPRQ